MRYPPEDSAKILKDYIGILKKMDMSAGEEIPNEYREILEKMEYSEACDILFRYGVIAEISTFVAAPVSGLPYPKEKIKQAIKYVLLVEFVTFLRERKVTKVEFMGTTTLDDLLQTNYILLARFIDDEQARLFPKFFSDEERRKMKDEEVWLVLKKINNILKQINQEVETLNREFELAKKVGMIIAMRALERH